MILKQVIPDHQMLQVTIYFSGDNETVESVLLDQVDEEGSIYTLSRLQGVHNRSRSL